MYSERSDIRSPTLGLGVNQPPSQPPDSTRATLRSRHNEVAIKNTKAAGNRRFSQHDRTCRRSPGRLQQYEWIQDHNAHFDDSCSAERPEQP